jgi:hypothetical protein
MWFLDSWIGSGLVFAAGVGQLALIVASLAVPLVLHWREETAKLRPLTRQVFWMYAGYIWTTNLCFGLLSALAPHWLLNRSPLAAAVTGFITFYWGARLIIQFTCLDRRDAPPGVGIRLAEIALVSLFGFLTLVYASATFVNLWGATT